jgi:uncharacterized protein (UPF0335 family)
MTEIGHNSKKDLVRFIERAERLIEEKSDLQNDLREVFSEAKSAGFDPKTMRKIIKLRAMDSETRENEHSLLITYANACGLAELLS